MLALDKGMLMTLNGNTFTEIKGTEKLSDKKIAALTEGPVKGTCLVATSVDGLYLLDGNRYKRRISFRKVAKEKEMAQLREKNKREALEKDFEIATLKSEQLEKDIRHKSSELSNTTMNLIRKNEILSEIHEKLAKVQDSLVSQEGKVALNVRRQLALIKSTINDNISHDDDFERFTGYFDIVYVDFTKNLLKRHPNLSLNDKRLCCYIKMGLSSKEIAPLINISYKSVEMARYRLRKKMDLPADVNLVEYLQNI